MSIGDINPYGWIFLISLAVILAGVLGLYINRSMIELVARLDRSEDAPQYSIWQAWLLPKYRAGSGRMANAEFHDSVDAKAKNGVSRTLLITTIVAVIVHMGLWIYLMNFTSGNVSFLTPQN